MNSFIQMTITEWLSAQKKLLEAATPGPWYMLGEYNPHGIYEGSHVSPVDCDNQTYKDEDWKTGKDNEFIASVRTEHERALKLIEKYREALNSIPILDTDIESETIRSEALAYFPDDSDDKHNAIMDEISDKWEGSEG